MSPATSLLRHAARPVVARSLDATSALRGIASAIVMGPGNVPGEGGAARGAAPTTAAPEASARVASAPLAEGENFKVLFCGDEFPEAYTYSAELLHKEPNMKVSWHPRAEIPRQIRDCHVVVPRMTRLEVGTIAEASKLRLIVQFGVGLEGVDVAAATARGIRVGRIPSADTGNAVSCAEHAIYLALALLRKQKRMQESIQQRRLGQPIGQTIFGKSVGSGFWVWCRGWSGGAACCMRCCQHRCCQHRCCQHRCCQVEI
ncbi:unnamed protein product [Closterium sp. NIES-65]|nr:unnamed protein product [Closterium sp. NIES-65]